MSGSPCVISSLVVSCVCGYGWRRFQIRVHGELRDFLYISSTTNYITGHIFYNFLPASFTGLLNVFRVYIKKLF
jgi:hypothetical protein